MNRKTLYRDHENEYRWLLRNKPDLLRECFPSEHKIYTVDEIPGILKTLSVTSVSDWIRKERKSYTFCYNRKLVDKMKRYFKKVPDPKVLAKLKKIKEIREYIKTEEINSSGDLKRKHKRYYDFLVRSKKLYELFPKVYGKWQNYEIVKEHLKKSRFINVSDWIEKSPGSYHAAYRNNWIHRLRHYLTSYTLRKTRAQNESAIMEFFKKDGVLPTKKTHPTLWYALKRFMSPSHRQHNSVFVNWVKSVSPDYGNGTKRPVISSNGMFFTSGRSACSSLKLSPVTLCHAISKKYRCGGYHWAYYNEKIHGPITTKKDGTMWAKGVKK